MSDKATNTAVEPDTKQLFITRMFDAPRELVFAAWSSPEHLMRWHAPNGCELTHCKMDFRVGGVLHSCIRIPGGKECWCRAVYLEIINPSRIVYTLTASDAAGRVVEPGDAGMAGDWPREMTVTVTLENVGGKTKLTLHQTVLESIAKRTGAYPSWLSMFERLDAELAKA